MRNNALININMIDAAAPERGQAVFLLVVGLHLPGHAPRRARVKEEEGLPSASRQRVRLGKALRGARGDGVRP